VTRTASGVLAVPPVARRAGAPLYRQIYEGYREAILELRLRPGQRLPSTRALAAELGISRIPVLNAFEQLLAEGYFESRVGAGTFVARSLPDRTAPAALGAPRASNRPGPRRVARTAVPAPARPAPWLGGWGPFRVSEPAVDHFPFPLWARLVARYARAPNPDLLNYHDPMGYRPFREAVAEYLRTARALRCDAGRIMVVSGSQQALVITARVLLDPGSAVWIEDPGYGGARDALRMAGADLVPVPVDAGGLDVGAGAAHCANARAVYVTPSHQYPLGVTMTASRRLQLLDWAQSRGAWIIEDDYDSEYRYESQPITALQGLDRDGRVIYIGTLSKVLFPALRIGYLVIPPDLVPRFAAVREATDLFPPTLPQAVLAEFIGAGHFARHVRRMRALYRERRSALVDAIAQEFRGALSVLGAEAGIHLVVTLPRGSRDQAVAARAAREGVWAMPLSRCYAGGMSRQGLVLGYGGAGADVIPAAVRRLRRIVHG
jgi:GntR family transcriptional regulator/MocR family aminotransferase